METKIPTPTNTQPYTPEFEVGMTGFMQWLTDNASKFGDVAEEVNDALNA